MAKDPMLLSIMGAILPFYQASNSLMGMLAVLTVESIGKLVSTSSWQQVMAECRLHLVLEGLKHLWKAL